MVQAGLAVAFYFGTLEDFVAQMALMLTLLGMVGGEVVVDGGVVVAYVSYAADEGAVEDLLVIFDCVHAL